MEPGSQALRPLPAPPSQSSALGALGGQSQGRSLGWFLEKPFVHPFLVSVALNCSLMGVSRTDFRTDGPALSRQAAFRALWLFAWPVPRVLAHGVGEGGKQGSVAWPAVEPLRLRPHRVAFLVLLCSL